MGLWPEGDKTYEPGFYMVYSSITVSLFIFGHIFFQVVNVYFIAHDLKSIVATSYLLLIEILGGVKAYYLIKNLKILKERMIIFKSDWFQPRNTQQRNLIEPTIYLWKTVYKVYLSMCFGGNTFWAIYPMMDKSEEKRLPFLGWYPYDYKKSPYYEITYVYQVIGICYLTTVHVNVDTLISAFNVYTSCQFDMLTDNIRNLANVAQRATNDVYHNMLRCVDHHKNILRFIESSTKFFNWILFWHLLISGVSIGLTMFQLTAVVPLSNEFYSLLSYGLAITIQIFMYCWFGNEVQAKSSNLPYAVFESDWTDLSEEIKKKLLFFTMHLKPVQISALNLFYLSLDTYMRINPNREFRGITDLLNFSYSTRKQSIRTEIFSGSQICPDFSSTSSKKREIRFYFNASTIFLPKLKVVPILPEKVVPELKFSRDHKFSLTLPDLK
ncbi:odorant receptor Or1-like [Zophobas morio]|uniref:odorant receptor Or1-like n=1 Tax=Zophobas morio TaxID=2755281 RepID=UPI0030830545